MPEVWQAAQVQKDCDESVSELTDLLREEAAESEPFTALPWPGAAAIIRRDVPDMCATLRLWRLHELPWEIREYLGCALDVLAEAAYACRAMITPANGREQGDDGDLPGSWRAW